MSQAVKQLNPPAANKRRILLFSSLRDEASPHKAARRESQVTTRTVKSWLVCLFANYSQVLGCRGGQLGIRRSVLCWEAAVAGCATRDTRYDLSLSLVRHFARVACLAPRASQRTLRCATPSRVSDLSLPPNSLRRRKLARNR